MKLKRLLLLFMMIPLYFCSQTKKCKHINPADSECYTQMMGLCSALGNGQVQYNYNTFYEPWKFYFNNTVVGIYTKYSSDDSYILYTENSGQTWEKISVGDSLMENVFVHCLQGSAVCYASARKTGKYFIMKSIDAGKTFSVIFEKSTPAIYFDKAMFFKDEFSGIILHDSGEIIGTSDSGKSWSSYSQTSQRYNSTITDFYYFNNRLWLISRYDLPLYSDNFGKTWTTVSGSYLYKYFSSIAISNNGKGWLAALGTLYWTTDNGNTWAVYAASSLNITDLSRISGAYFFDQQNAVLWTDSVPLDFKIFITSDGGTSWTSAYQFSGSADVVYILNKYHIIIKRDKKYYITDSFFSSWKSIELTEFNETGYKRQEIPPICAQFVW